ncbi:hypothetical protein R567_01950 [Salmonella enterica subsp. enterica serovar Enteritidis]|nr:hypothetical protein R567_01950 [Salmonella enterica subsp. enterica serovar Enteritidis]OSG16756.1 hypothetical protein R561_01950 [Salmonella enterica subsp. enterica serovar Enteritidis]
MLAHPSADAHERHHRLKGKAMTERIDAAREQMGKVVFKDWPQDELDVFVRLMQKFADAMDSDASMPE